MSIENYNTLSEAVNALTKDGYTESFTAKENNIQAAQSKKEFQPNELKIVKTFRFDGMTNPADESEVFALQATDGSKGTMVMSYSSEQSQNIELIKQIEKA